VSTIVEPKLSGGDEESGGDVGVIELIRRVQRREVKPSSLSGEDRRACVEYLTAEGYSAAEIAGVLRTSDRTVLRDRQRIRKSNALKRDPALVEQMVGKLLGEAETAVSRLRRVARDAQTSAAVKVEAERSAWTVTRELVQSLQRLGYLPMATAQVRAELTHRVEEPPSVEELAQELERLESIRAGCRVRDDTVTEQVGRVKEALARVAAGEAIGRLAAAIENHLTGTEANDNGGETEDD